MNSPSKSNPASPAAPGAVGFRSYWVPSGSHCEFCPKPILSYVGHLAAQAGAHFSGIRYTCTCAADRARTLFCYECRYADPTNAHLDPEQRWVCGYEKAARISPVLGPMLNTCADARADSALCGPAARWWEAL